jgi:PAS domain-containing protein/DNA-binding CsgD family transcriptional regulator
MRSNPSPHTISGIYDAAIASELWPSALQSVIDDIGGVGAGYGVFNKRTGEIEWLSQTGLLLDAAVDFISYYHALDPYRPFLETMPAGTWVRVSDCLPANELRRSEWYNDYLLKAGIDDGVGVRLFESASHTVIFGVSHGIDQAPFTVADVSALQKLLEPLAKAARLHMELRSLGCKSTIGLCALDELAGAVIVANSNGQVINANWAAERILQRGDGLAIANGKLSPLDASDSAKLGAFIASAATDQKTEAAIGRMRIRRRDDGPPYILMVAPLGADLAFYGRPLAIILLVDPDERAPPERELAEFFGLSPAESRLAAALLAGKKLREIAVDSGVQLTTLRTQLSSVLRKTATTRQVDLIRVLLSVPMILSRF